MRVFNEYASLPLSLKIAIPVGILLLAVISANLLYHQWASSISEEIATFVPLNDYYVAAMSVALFVVISFAFSQLISVFGRKRRLGYFTIVFLLIGSNVALGYFSSGVIFSGRTGVATKCYVFSGGKVTYFPITGDGRWKYDPETGLECVEVTPDTKALLDAASRGEFPQKLAGKELPVFFDAALGTALVWYHRGPDTKLEMFDKDGIHPSAGVRLRPVTPEIVLEWKKQLADTVPPVRLTSVDINFFDVTTGEPVVWYWRGDSGQFEFFDRPGFHPVFGSPLKIVSHEIVRQYRKALEDEIAAEERREVLHKQEIAAIQVAGDECDRLAGNRYDRYRNPSYAGVEFRVLSTIAGEAIRACELAVESEPHEGRYLYQLGRAKQARSTLEAESIMRRLVSKRYPAAFDNLALIVLAKDRRNFEEALSLFRGGVELDDPQAMVSLAQLFAAGNGVPKREDYAMQLLEKAASMGHEQASIAVAEYEEKRRAGQIALGAGLTLLGILLKDRR